eukprot:SAG31_NODE_15598_length_747_cov_1.253086_2_plen_147_part_01
MQIDAANDDGSTAFIYACAFGHVDIAEALISAGCDIDWRDDQGLTGTEIAQAEGYAEIVKLVKETKDKRSPDHCNSSPRSKQLYRCRSEAIIRAGFALLSEEAGRLSPGDVIDALEICTNKRGQTRVRFARGWVSTTSGSGLVLLEP